MTEWCELYLLRKGSLKSDVLPGWHVPFCPRCGWVRQAGVHSLHRRQVDNLQDQGPLLLLQNPDAFAIYEDPEGEGPPAESPHHEQTNAYRSLKTAGALLPADQISTLPDAPARRLLLAFEFT